MRCASLCLLIALTAAAGCGGGDEQIPEGGARGASGPAGLTAQEFLPKLLPEKTSALQEVVAVVPECGNVKVEPAFVLLVSDAASSAAPETPLIDLVEAEC